MEDKHPKRLVLAGCDPNRKSWNTVMGPLSDPTPHGSLWVYDPSKPTVPSSNPARITLAGYPAGHDFHPLGFEIWPSYSGNASSLYVVNHARARTVIEHFVLDPSAPTKAKYIRTISSPYFVSPNAVALTSPNSFYVTNDHIITRRWPMIGPVVPVLESVFGIPLTFASHITLKDSNDPEVESHTFAAKWLSFPNGIAISSSGRLVAIASSSLSQVYYYARDPSTNALTPLPERTVQMPFCPDNVRFAEREGKEDELIVAGHPYFPSLILISKNVTTASPGSWVISVIPTSDSERKEKPSEAKDSYFQDTFDPVAPVSASSMVSVRSTYTLKTLFQSNGEKGGFSSSTTGIWDPESKVLYVSGLYADQGVVACRSRK